MASVSSSSSDLNGSTSHLFSATYADRREVPTSKTTQEDQKGRSKQARKCDVATTEITESFFSQFEQLHLSSQKENLPDTRHSFLSQREIDPCMPQNSDLPFSFRRRLLTILNARELEVEDAHPGSSLETLRSHNLLTKLALFLTVNEGEDKKPELIANLHRQIETLASIPHLSHLNYRIAFDEDIILVERVNEIPFTLNFASFQALNFLKLSFDYKPLLLIETLAHLPLTYLDITFYATMKKEEKIIFRSQPYNGEEDLTDVYPHLSLNNVSEQEFVGCALLTSLLATVRELNFSNLVFSSTFTNQCFISYASKVNQVIFVNFDFCTMSSPLLNSLEGYFNHRTVNIFNTRLTNS